MDARALRREALVLEFSAKIDPENLLNAKERRRLAEQAVRDHFHALGKKSGRVRRQRAARLEAFEAAAKVKVGGAA